MTNLSAWKKACIVFLLCAATAIAAPAQTVTSLLSFDGADGAEPYYGSLVQGPDGNFYGTTWEGGGNTRCKNSHIGCGTVFSITPGGTLTTVHKFCTVTGCPDGAYPYGGLVVGVDGDLYGTTSAGGANGQGTVFKIIPDGALKTLHSFDGSDGTGPYGTLIQASDGDFYGTTYQGGGVNNDGTVFKMTPSGTLTTLYSFCSQPDCTDGVLPIAGLVEGTDGNLYGTTVEGGLKNKDYGTIFKITPAGVLTTLHSFDSHDGSYPYGGLVQGGESFYGTTGNYGPNGEGTIFKITSQGTFTTVYGFSGMNYGAGAYPYDGLIQATDGSLYGTTSKGGIGGNLGTVFDIASGGAVTTLYSFDGTDGTNPVGGLVQSTDGNFYGTTRIGGTNDYGTVFSLSMALEPFVRMVSASGKAGHTSGILGQGFTGTTSVLFNGISAAFTIVADTYLTATVPAGATTGYVTATTPSGTLTSNVPFHVLR
jgi:uncharacterized repeat protein (TIGR03803 family)